MADSVEIELLPLTEMVDRMFPGFVEYIKKKHGSVRDFYETSTAITQCNNTVGQVVRGQTKCWICGYTIPETPGPEHGFAPECEHVFPIAQALFFIGLYSNEAKENGSYKEKLKLEYDWAHRVCNQVKNDAHFIEHNIQNPDGRWFINRTKITQFLMDILARGDKYGKGATLIKQQIKKEGITTTKWIEQQTDSIYKRCTAILSTIRPGDESLWTLATVSDLTHAYQTSGFVPEVIIPYTPVATPSEVRPLDHQLTIRIYASWSEFIMKHVHDFMVAYLAERLQRYSPEQKAFRAQKVLEILDRSLISKAGQHVWGLYGMIPNDVNKQVRFVEAVQYIISGIVLERITRMFTDVTDAKSPSLQKLKSELHRNIELIRDIWVANKLSDHIQYLNSLLETNLKGARRKRNFTR